MSDRLTQSVRLERMLTAAEFRDLAEVPPAAEWFANLDNANTRRSYQNDLQEFMRFIGISAPAELRLVTRAHVLAWRKNLERRELSGSTIRRKLVALSSLFEYLSEANTVTHNPVKGVRRPKVEGYEGQTRRRGGVYTEAGISASIADAASPNALMADIRRFIQDCLAHGRDLLAGSDAELAVGISVGDSVQFVASIDLLPTDICDLAALGMAFSVTAYPTSDSA